MIEIIPTVVPKSARDVAALCARFPTVSLFHVDATDGAFAFPATWVPSAGEQLPDGPLFEAHLMAEDPRAAGERFIRAGAWRIIGHAEALQGEDGISTLAGWRAMGAHEVGVALKLDSPLSLVEHLAPHADVLHLMTIRKVGAQGQPFDTESLDRIADARARFPRLVIAADGGISETNIPDLIRAGVSRLCIGSALSRADEPAAAFARLHELAMSAVQ